MLEKKYGEINMPKLRAILLLEEDFNAISKIVFNTRLILRLEDKESIPREIIISRRGKSAIHIALNKKLLADIFNQSKLLYIMISMGASNYFDRVAYPVTRMIY